MSEPTKDDFTKARRSSVMAFVRGAKGSAGYENALEALATLLAEARAEKHKTCCEDCTHCEDTALEVQALYSNEYQRGFDEGRIAGRREMMEEAAKLVEASGFRANGIPSSEMHPRGPELRPMTPPPESLQKVADLWCASKGLGQREGEDRKSVV